jgi:hypothetical protein
LGLLKQGWETTPVLLSAFLEIRNLRICVAEERRDHREEFPMMLMKVLHAFSLHSTSLPSSLSSCSLPYSSSNSREKLSLSLPFRSPSKK